MKRLQKLTVLLLLLLFTAVLCLSGCQKAAKKPLQPSRTQTQVKIAPEVLKYKQEPTISLYRSATGAKEQIKLEKYIKGVVAGRVQTFWTAFFRISAPGLAVVFTAGSGPRHSRTCHIELGLKICEGSNGFSFGFG